MGRAAAAKGSNNGRGMRAATSGAELGVGGTVPEGDAVVVAEESRGKSEAEQ